MLNTQGIKIYSEAPKAAKAFYIITKPIYTNNVKKISLVDKDNTSKLAGYIQVNLKTVYNLSDDFLKAYNKLNQTINNKFLPIGDRLAAVYEYLLEKSKNPDLPDSHTSIEISHFHNVRIWEKHGKFCFWADWGGPEKEEDYMSLKDAFKNLLASVKKDIDTYSQATISCYPWIRDCEEALFGETSYKKVPLDEVSTIIKPAVERALKNVRKVFFMHEYKFKCLQIEKPTKNWPGDVKPEIYTVVAASEEEARKKFSLEPFNYDEDNAIVPYSELLKHKIAYMEKQKKDIEDTIKDCKKYLNNFDELIIDKNTETNYLKSNQYKWMLCNQLVELLINANDLHAKIKNKDNKK